MSVSRPDFQDCFQSLHKNIWNLCWRRQLFAWEEELVQELLHTIDQYNIIDGLEDEMNRQFEASRIFLVKSFSLQINAH